MILTFFIDHNQTFIINSIERSALKYLYFFLNIF